MAKGQLREAVSRLPVEEQWSPEQISNRLAKEGKATVSYNTIYRAIKAGIMEAKGTRKNRHGRYPMSKYLRCKGWREKKKSNRSPHHPPEHRGKAKSSGNEKAVWPLGGRPCLQQFPQGVYCYIGRAAFSILVDWYQ